MALSFKGNYAGARVNLSKLLISALPWPFSSQAEVCGTAQPFLRNHVSPPVRQQVVKNPPISILTTTMAMPRCVEGLQHPRLLYL
jgi:hypothetical protein